MLPQAEISRSKKTMLYQFAEQSFARFRCGNLYVKNATHSARPIVKKVDAIIDKINQGHQVSCNDIAKKLNINHQTVLNHLKMTGYKK